MSSYGGRLEKHPILDPPDDPVIPFTFDGKNLTARAGEVISSALFAAGIRIFGLHARDGAPQGIFCVNGQCSQCMVMANNRPVKACMAEVAPGMKVESAAGTAPAPVDEDRFRPGDPRTIDISVLVVGGGPAGLSAAMELGRLGVDVLVVDDKPEIGGKLTLQTHEFFGSVKDCWAGTRGTDIGRLLADSLAGIDSVQVWTSTTAVGVYEEGTVGLLKDGRFAVARPAALLVATGAREKSLAFPGADLPGVYGAGAFQTLVNRDLVRAAERIFVVGGGNVGLIGAYHALQAGIDVVGLVEALPECGGYKVHADKLARFGTPVWTSHTVVEAHGKSHVEGVTIARIDESFSPVPGTRRRFDVDTVLLAVGLSPVSEFVDKARSCGMPVFTAGDAEEIAEASAAIFSGRIAGRRIARFLGRRVEIPENWAPLSEILKSPGGEVFPLEYTESENRFQAVLHCNQEIPCNPCVDACPEGLISIAESKLEESLKGGGGGFDSTPGEFTGKDAEGGAGAGEGSPPSDQESPVQRILGIPLFEGECTGCAQCVLLCPGLAITLVHQGRDPALKTAKVAVPFEFEDGILGGRSEVTVVDIAGEPLGKGEIVRIRRKKSWNRRALADIKVPRELRYRVAGFRIREPFDGDPVPDPGPAGASVPTSDIASVSTPTPASATASVSDTASVSASASASDTASVSASVPDSVSASAPASAPASGDGDAEVEADPIICRCERVRKSEITAAIRDGVRDMNALKALLRCGMGACGGKTCTDLIKGLYRECGIDLAEVTPPTIRPLVFEVPLSAFAPPTGEDHEPDL